MSQFNQVTAAATVYHSIRETARITGLSEYFIRQRVRAGVVPGTYSGKKFLVNVPSLLESLNTSTGEVKTNEQQ